MSARYLSDVAEATAQHRRETLADDNLGKQSGEHRLPASPSRQLVEMMHLDAAA